MTVFLFAISSHSRWVAAVQLQVDQSCDQTSIRAPAAHEVQFALSLAKEADRPIKEQAF